MKYLLDKLRQFRFKANDGTWVVIYTDKLDTESDLIWGPADEDQGIGLYEQSGKLVISWDRNGIQINPDKNTVTDIKEPDVEGLEWVTQQTLRLMQETIKNLAEAVKAHGENISGINGNFTKQLGINQQLIDQGVRQAKDINELQTERAYRRVFDEQSAEAMDIIRRAADKLRKRDKGKADPDTAMLPERIQDLESRYCDLERRMDGAELASGVVDPDEPLQYAEATLEATQQGPFITHTLEYYEGGLRHSKTFTYPVENEDAGHEAMANFAYCARSHLKDMADNAAKNKEVNQPELQFEEQQAVS